MARVLQRIRSGFAGGTGPDFDLFRKICRRIVQAHTENAVDLAPSKGNVPSFENEPHALEAVQIE